eukprot:scpid47450/ scgid29462/ Protein asunder homolog; Cell cycle regulator Mat89Bb homolog; Sarcoma antigen NY-SAR-95
MNSGGEKPVTRLPTVILIHCTTESSAPCGKTFMIETAKPGAVSTPSRVSKSAWTVSVEGAIEYTRVVYDLFPERCKVQVMVHSSTGTQLLNSWESEEQRLPLVLAEIGRIGAPPATTASCDIPPGVSAAIESLGGMFQKQGTANSGSADTRARVIILSPTIRSERISATARSISQLLRAYNQQVAQSNDGRCAVQGLEVEMIHLTENTVPAEKAVLPPHISLTVHSCFGQRLMPVMSSLCREHYNMASTIITGIPMKEEQQGGVSCNYDVELFHEADIHKDLLPLGLPVITTGADSGHQHSSVTLRWSNPRTITLDVQFCSHSCRVSPVEVNSRPSSCLFNFVLGGRSVMLEQPRRTNFKHVSHILFNHGGGVFLHCLPNGKSFLEDPPSISEAAGGKVTDYRTSEFGVLMRSNLLVPFAEAPNTAGDMLPVDRALQQLERSTRIWPLVYGDTVLFNMNEEVQNLLTLLTYERLSDQHLTECRRVIYQLQAMEGKNQPLPTLSGTARQKTGHKREDQYRQLWSELETVVVAASTTSPRHQEVLESLRQCRSVVNRNSFSQSDGRQVPAQGNASSAAGSRDSVWKEYDMYREGEAPDTGDKSRTSSPTASRQKDATGAPGKIKTPKFRPHADGVLGLSMKVRSGVSLKTLWMEHHRRITTSGHTEFAGRAMYPGQKALLYAHLDLDGRKAAAMKEL